MLRFINIALALGIMLFLSPPQLVAGPPLICHPIEIADASSLPFGEGAFGYDATYDATNLVAETKALLEDESSVIVRMETIRRSVLYATKNLDGARHGNTYNAAAKDKATKLLNMLKNRADEQKKGTAAYAHSLFDLGYAMECFRQAQMFNTDGGYALVAMASDLLNTPPEVEFALAMMSKHPERPSLKEHFAAAARGADGLLQRNLKDHFSGEEYAHLK